MPPDRAAAQLLPWQADAWQQLQLRRRQGRLPHALLLDGPVGIGKQRFAQRLAQALVCEHGDMEQQPCGECKSCHLASLGSHPDIHWLTPREEGKQIRVDAVREMIARTSLTTQARGSRVFLISPADAMNRSTANALLKTLEEPVASSVLILVSSRAQTLPATIRSRCQGVTFRPVARELARAWLASQVADEDVEALLALAAGAPLTALRAAEEGWLGRVGEVIDQLLALKLRQRNPMQVVEQWGALDLSGLLEDLGRITHDLAKWLAAGLQADLLLPQHTVQLQSLAKDINLLDLFGFIDELNRLRLRMMNNLNPHMLLEKIVIDWLALTRRRVD